MSSAEVAIGLINPKSPSNVGAVMRAAGCYRVNQVFYTGERYARAAKFHTDTKSAIQKIPLIALESLLEQPLGCRKIVCVEMVEGATPLPHFQHPDDAFYIFGPEDGTIPQEVIDRAEAVVYIPTVGCMNLAATVNVVLYDRLAKSENIELGDELIRQSRDKNNTVRVRAG